jgi:hypothetical protein
MNERSAPKKKKLSEKQSLQSSELKAVSGGGIDIDSQPGVSDSVGK